MLVSRYRLIFTLLLMSICILAALIVASFVPPQNSDTDPAVPHDFAYFMKASGSQILVYRTGETEAVYTLDTPLDVLPQTDRTDLQEGFYIPDEEALRRIIEDFEG